MPDQYTTLCLLTVQFSRTYTTVFFTVKSTEICFANNWPQSIAALQDNIRAVVSSRKSGDVAMCTL
jgi:hypothetical protein